jgi:hypothetical protein
MSFGEYVTAGGFNQKTVKGDLFVKVNHIYHVYGLSHPGGGTATLGGGTTRGHPA